MNNLQLPAYPITEGDFKRFNGAIGEWTGFTKLELASLMIAQGFAANSPDWSENEPSVKWIAINSVKYAKAIIEEANNQTH